MKKLMLAAALLFAFSSFAQTPTVRFGEEFKSTNVGGNVPIFLGTHNGNVYLLRLEGRRPSPSHIQMSGDNSTAILTKALTGLAIINDDDGMFDLGNYTKGATDSWLNGKIHLQKFDPSYRLLYDKVLETKIDKKPLKITKVALLGDRLYEYYTTYNSSTHTTSSYVQELDEATGETKSDVKHLDDFTWTYNTNTAMQNTFEYEINQDSSLVVQRFHQNKPSGMFGTYQKDTVQQLFMWLRWIDRNGSAVASKKLPLDVLKNNGMFINWWVAKDGTVYILDRENKHYDWNSQDKSEQAYGYVVLVAKPSSGKFTRAEVELKDKRFLDINGHLNNNGDLVLAGLYGDLHGSSGLMQSFERAAQGYYLTTFNANAQAITSFTTPFSESVYKEISSSKDSSDDEDKDKKNASRFHLRKVYTSNTGYLLILEKYFITDVSTYNGGGSTYNHNASTYSGENFTYEYDDMVAIKIDSIGNMVWAKKIPKKQRTMQDAGLFSSFISAYHNNNLYIVYNANKDEPSKKMKNPAMASAYLAVVNPNGQMTNTVLFNSKEEEKKLAPRICFDPGTGKVITYYIYQTQQSIGSIDF